MSTEHDRLKYQSHEPRDPVTFEADVIVSPDTRRDDRIPPGQSRTRKWPVLHAGVVPTVPVEGWELEMFGLVRAPLRLSWDEFQAMPRTRVYADFHCVTRWSRLDNVWEGVLVRQLLERAGIASQAKYVILHAHDDGWTTNLPLPDFIADDALLADTHDGRPLSPDHGGPVRAIVPRLYAWKSAKWIRAIELSAVDRPGFWERDGYHNHGDPWREERFGG